MRMRSRVVGGYRLAAVAADAQAVACERERARLSLDPSFADLLVPVIQGEDAGAHAWRILAVLLERGRQDEVLPRGNVLGAVDLLLEHTDEVIDIVQPAVPDVESMAAEPRPVREQDSF